MSNQTEEPTPAQPEEPGFIQKWIGMYFSPTNTFQSLNRKPDWVLPLLVLAVISTVGSIFLTDVIMTTQMEAGIENMMDQQGLSQAEAESRMEQGAVFMKYGIPIWGFLSAFVVAFVVAGVFYLVNSYILGGTSTYKTVLSVYSYSALALGSIGAVISIPIMRAKNSLVAPLGPAAFLSEEMKDEFIYKLLAKFDIFTIWMAVLLIIGFGVIYKFSHGKAAASVLGLWLIWILISIPLGM